MVDKRRKKEIVEIQDLPKKQEVMMEEKNPDRPKYNSAKVKCPYCDHEDEQKIKFSFTSSIPNLIECEACHYHYIVMQRVEIINTVVEIQDQLERSYNSAGIISRSAEAGTRDASV